MRHRPAGVAATKIAPIGVSTMSYADVEVARRSRRVAEPAIELRCDLHASPSFLRSLRIPDDAACLAASADEPSAAPISE